MKTSLKKSVKISCVKYFNGFSLQGEETLFGDYLPQSDLCVAGFSYGAQKAFEYVYHTQERIDRLILLSPAFFQPQKKSFIRTQLRYFEADKASYITQFLQNSTYPSTEELSRYLKTGTKEELEALLTYTWDENRIKEVFDRGTVIEVFLGEEDKIISAKSAHTFFSQLLTTYTVKNVGHILH